MKTGKKKQEVMKFKMAKKKKIGGDISYTEGEIPDIEVEIYE